LHDPQPVRETIVFFARDVGARFFRKSIASCIGAMIRSFVYRG